MTSKSAIHSRASHMPIEIPTSTMVAHGREPNAGAETPGIRRSRGARLAFVRRDRRGLGSEIVPSRSILGARLRRRVPQYGHSVMYGETSAPQFLQTTKRSGPLAMGPIDSTVESGARGFDDLGHDLAEVVVGLVDHHLALRAAAALEQVPDACEVVRGAHLLGVLTQAIEQPAGEILRRDPVARGQVDELPTEPVAGRQPLVLVEDLERVVRELLAGL